MSLRACSGSCWRPSTPRPQLIRPSPLPRRAWKRGVEPLAALRHADCMRSMRLMISMATAGALVLAAGCSSAGSPRRQPALPSAPRYYLSLGDSLSQGVQPTPLGQSDPTGNGYPDRSFSVLRGRQPGWQLEKLGCSGETTQTMIHGGICRYAARSQLAQAEV